jgi:hypothetical protein
LMKAASTYVEPQSRESELGEESIPSHFFCPILQVTVVKYFIVTLAEYYVKYQIITQKYVAVMQLFGLLKLNIGRVILIAILIL